MQKHKFQDDVNAWMAQRVSLTLKKQYQSLLLNPLRFKSHFSHWGVVAFNANTVNHPNTADYFHLCRDLWGVHYLISCLILKSWFLFPISRYHLESEITLDSLWNYKQRKILFVFMHTTSSKTFHWQTRAPFISTAVCFVEQLTDDNVGTWWGDAEKSFRNAKQLTPFASVIPTPDRSSQPAEQLKCRASALIKLHMKKKNERINTSNPDYLLNATHQRRILTFNMCMKFINSKIHVSIPLFLDYIKSCKQLSSIMTLLWGLAGIFFAPCLICHTLSWLFDWCECFLLGLTTVHFSSLARSQEVCCARRLVEQSCRSAVKNN